MFFYKYVYSHNGEEVDEKSFGDAGFKIENTTRGLRNEAVICKEFCEELNDIQFFIINKTDMYISFLCLFNGNLRGLRNIDRKADDLIIRLNLDMIINKRIELTAYTFLQELNLAENNHFLQNAREIKDSYDLYFTGGMWFKERKLPQKTFTKEEILKQCEPLIVDNELKVEVERTFQKARNVNFNVPVHYFVNIGNDEECQNVVQILLRSLKSNNRTIRNYYSVVDLTLKDRLRGINRREVSKVFDINIGGVVVINANFKINDDDLFSDEHMITDMYAEEILNYATNVTTIICCKHKSQENLFKEKLKDLLLIDINDKTITNEHAKKYLIDYAIKLDIDQTTGLTDMVEENISYKVDDLIKLFTKWHKTYVQTIQYPQYAGLMKQTIDISENKEESALSYLKDMVGLSEVKKTIDSFINYAKLQKACNDNGAVAKNTCKHMCFIGNPGTAKTTVARYVAQVMKENKLLSRGNLIEVGRADIVSRYVGGTAPQVQELFRKAIGNVLFIDEAYSLYDGKDGMYGDEAINAIVQEMENKRDDLVVIFAGYKNEMERFLNKNSGLKSRIASIIEFPDYTEDELVDIAKLHAKRMDINISECEDKIKEIVSLTKSKEHNFGNGRFIRNILEQARMKQASRLVKEDKMFGEYLKILKPEDFEMPTFKEKTQMGFC